MCVSVYIYEYEDMFTERPQEDMGALSLTLRLNSFSCPVSGTVSTPQSLGYRHRQADVPGFLC